MVLVGNRTWPLTTRVLLHRPATNGLSKAVLSRIAQDSEQMIAEGMSTFPIHHLRKMAELPAILTLDIIVLRYGLV